MITYQSQSFKESDIVKVYIAYNVYGTELKQYDVNAQGYTIRESIKQESDFPLGAVAQAYSLKEKAFKQVQVA